MYARRMAQSWRWRNRCFCCHDSWFCSHFSFSHLFSHESNTWEYHSLLVLSKSSVRILNTWTQLSLTWRLSVVMMSRTWDFMQSLLAEVFWTSQCPLNHEFLPKNISHNFFFGSICVIKSVTKKTLRGLTVCTIFTQGRTHLGNDDFFHSRLFKWLNTTLFWIFVYGIYMYMYLHPIKMTKA